MTRIQLPGAAGWIIHFSLIKPGNTVRTFIYCKDHSNILRDIKEGSATAACRDSLLQAPLIKSLNFHLPTNPTCSRGFFPGTSLTWPCSAQLICHGTDRDFIFYLGTPDSFLSKADGKMMNSDPSLPEMLLMQQFLH